MSIIYSHLGDAIQKLMANDSPILFCDTCALLDLIRLPHRENQPTKVASYIEAVSSILKGVSSGNISLAVPPPVYDEWTEQSPNVCKETEKVFNDLDKKLDITRTIAQHGKISFPLVNVNQLNLTLLLYELSNDIMKTSLKIPKESHFLLKATERASSFIPPSSKGAIKDCILYEHTLGIIQELREQSFEHNIVFITSNTNDFCEKGKPKEPIKTELSQLKTNLVTNWSWAYQALKSSSNINPSSIQRNL